VPLEDEATTFAGAGSEERCSSLAGDTAETIVELVG
jgi:hypothetical protein